MEQINGSSTTSFSGDSWQVELSKNSRIAPASNPKFTLQTVDGTQVLTGEIDDSSIYLIELKDDVISFYKKNNDNLSLISQHQSIGSEYVIKETSNNSIYAYIAEGITFNTQESFVHLNNTKADKTEMEDTFIEVNTNINSKIGKTDLMNVIHTPSLTINKNYDESAFISEPFYGDSWSITASTKDTNTHADFSFESFIDGEWVGCLVNIYAAPDQYSLSAKTITFTYPASQYDYRCKVECVYSNSSGYDVPLNGYIDIDKGCLHRLVCSNNTSGVEMTINLNSEASLVTESALKYLSLEKADKTEVESSLEHLNDTKADKTEVDNKVGKFDTVLSVNDGEYNTDYNVEGALGYLQSEIEAMNVIDCGTY